MFQVIFNPISAAEMSVLPKELQLDLLCEFEIYPKTSKASAMKSLERFIVMEENFFAIDASIIASTLNPIPKE